MQYHPSLSPSQAFLRCPSGSPVPSLTTPHWVSIPTPPIMTSVPAPSTGQLHSPRGHETLHRYHEVQWEFPSEQAESGKCSGQGPRARSSRPEGNSRQDSQTPHQPVKGRRTSQAPPRCFLGGQSLHHTSWAGMRRDGSAPAGADRRPQHKQVVGREDLAIT